MARGDIGTVREHLTNPCHRSAWPATATSGPGRRRPA
nr:hypothetical protein [Amycolatopsis methanolica]